MRAEPTLEEVVAAWECTPGQALYWNRVQANVRLRELARQLGISPRALSDYENDRRPASLELRQQHEWHLRLASGRCPECGLRPPRYPAGLHCQECFERIVTEEIARLQAEE